MIATEVHRWLISDCNGVSGEPYCLHDAPRIARLARALAHDVAAVDAAVSTYGASRMLANDEVEGQAPGHSEFAWRNAVGRLACNKPYHCFSKICCATILRYRNTTFISCQQMFLNAETPSMIPGFVREINHAFLWEDLLFKVKG